MLQSSNENKETLNCVIEHLEEEEFMVRLQNSIRLTSLICLGSRDSFDSYIQCPLAGYMLAENAVKAISKAPCCCFENALTIDLLLF